MLGLLMVLAALALVFWWARTTAKGTVKELSYSEFLSSARSGKVAKVSIQFGQGNTPAVRTIKGVLKEGKTEFIVYAPDDPKMYEILSSTGVEISTKPDDSSWLAILGSVVYWIIPVVLFVWIFNSMRQMQGGGGSGAMAFGKSRARLMNSNQPKVTFSDVAGVEEAKEELREIIEFLKDPGRFSRLGGRIPKGVLLLGPPGSGKTLLARAVAGEAGVPFYSISGSDFVEMFVGVGAARVRDLFEQGKKSAPCIIFIDEIDAVGRHRGAGLGGGHDEREQTLNAMLVEMDGFDTNRGVIIMAATNRPDVLDPALLRPGRFDRHVVVDNPDINGREGILKVHARNIPMGVDVDLKKVARGTPGFSGADLANLVNEAALLAARRGKKFVEMNDLEEAKDKELMGPARRSRIISDREKKVTAYHESGHALVNWLVPGSDPLHKVTIIPRGQALGVTSSLPTEDRYNRTRHEFMNDITMLLGGRAAEKILLNEMTTGAANDLERATNLAHRMVCEFGMNDRLGPRTYGRRDREIFLGRDFMRERNYSEETAQRIDEEIQKIIDGCFKRAVDLLTKNKKRLLKLANALLEREVLDGEEVDRLLKTGGGAAVASAARTGSAPAAKG
jgi:cell division protease FtsH